MYPVIVIGSPRSGTSVVARILQEHLGVMMDEGPIRKDAANPNGYYEDQRLVAINQIAIVNWQMGRNHEQKIDREWAAKFGQWLVYRNLKYPVWGFKDPRMVGLISWVKQFVPAAIWIWPQRTDEQIIRSQVRKLGVSEQDAVNGVIAYKNLINKNLNNYHTINLSTQLTDNQIAEQLKEILKNGHVCDAHQGGSRSVSYSAFTTNQRTA